MEGQLGEKSSRAHCENMENTPLHCIVRKCNVDSTAGITVNPLCRNGYRHWYSQASRAARKKMLDKAPRSMLPYPYGDTTVPHQTEQGHQAGKDGTP